MCQCGVFDLTEQARDPRTHVCASKRRTWKRMACMVHDDLFELFLYHVFLLCSTNVQVLTSTQYISPVCQPWIGRALQTHKDQY